MGEMADAEPRTKQRRVWCMVLLVVCLLVTQISGFWLRRCAELFDQLGMADKLPVVTPLGMKVAFLLHPWGWIVLVAGFGILLLLVGKGWLDRVLLGVNIVSIIWSLMMALATFSTVMAVVHLQRSLQE